MAFRGMTLVPAYGRDYKSKKEVLKDWDDNKDFMISCMFHHDDGRYINKEQAQKGDTFNIRYKQLTQICAVRVK